MAEDKTVSSRIDFEPSTGGVSSNGSATAGSSVSQTVLDTTGPKMRVDPEDTTQRGFYTSTAPMRLLEFPVVPAIRRPSGRFNARSSLRTQWINKILADLRDIQPHCGTPEMAIYAASLLRNMRAIRDALPTDPFTDVIMALYDAMAYKNSWVNYSDSQYANARELLKRVASDFSLDNRKANSAIKAIEAIGFDTMPFELDWTDFDDEPALNPLQQGDLAASR